MYTRPVPLARRRRRSAAGSPDRSGFAVTSQRSGGRSSSGRRSTAGPARPARRGRGRRGPSGCDARRKDRGCDARRRTAIAARSPLASSRARAPFTRGRVQRTEHRPRPAPCDIVCGAITASPPRPGLTTRQNTESSDSYSRASVKSGAIPPMTRSRPARPAGAATACGAVVAPCASPDPPGTSRRAACDWPCSEPAPIARECRYWALSTRQQSGAAIRRDSDEATRASWQLSSSLQVSSRNRTIRTEMTTWHSKWEQANDQNEDSSV